jgi:hypothetical protein
MQTWLPPMNPQVPVLQVLPGSQQGWPMPPQAWQRFGPCAFTQLWPEAEQNPLKPLPQQGWFVPPHCWPPLEHAPVSVQVPAPPPQGMPPATQTPFTFRHRPALQALPAQAGWFTAPQAAHVPPPPPPPRQETPAS